MATILVVDDDSGMRRVARIMLENAGHQVVEAADGIAAIGMLQGCSPDLIITDLVMPGQEGIETIREIRRLGLDVPVLAVSGGGRMAQLGYLDIAVELGADRALAKPYRSRELLAVVEEMLRESRQRTTGDS